jgi:hypothetical protein
VSNNTRSIEEEEGTMKGIRRSIGLVAAVACIAAPGAFAMLETSSGGGASAVPYVANSSSHPTPQAQLAIPYLSQGVGVDPALWGGTGVVGVEQDNSFITDTLGGNGLPQQAPGYRFVTDTLGGTGGAPLPVAATPGDGFHWGDAGIGIGGAVGLFLLMTGAALLVQRRRPVAAA